MHGRWIISHEVADVYRKISYDAAPYDLRADGSVEIDESRAPHKFIRDLLKIEELVTLVLTIDQPAFRIEERNGLSYLNRLPLARYFSIARSLADSNSPDYKYSSNVQLYFECWTALGLCNEGFFNPSQHSSKAGKKQFELFNDLLDAIREMAKDPKFKKAAARGEENCQRNYDGSVDYIDALFDRVKTRLLVLRVDLSYSKELAHEVSVRQAKADFAHLLRNRRSNRALFEEWVGYIWKLEWAAAKGFHFHIIFFFNGAKNDKDVYWAKEIGEYWKKITEGRGIYWNCNAHKEKYIRLGIGRIDHWDVTKRKALTEHVVRYLTKSEQYLMATRLSGEKCFGKGWMPKARTSRAGRPRREAI